MEYLAILNIAFFASLSHCAGMCGGVVFVLNQKSARDKQNILLANSLYNIGRMSSYCVIGAICGGIGVAFTITPFLTAITLIMMGCFVSMMAVFFLVAPKLLNFLDFNLQKQGMIVAFFQKLFLSSSYKSFYFLGVLNGLIPCGIVYYFALVALATASAIEGAFVMFLFGLCTFVSMFLLGIFSSFILKLKIYQKQIYRISAFFMLLFGLYIIYKGIKGL